MSVCKVYCIFLQKAERRLKLLLMYMGDNFLEGFLHHSCNCFGIRTVREPKPCTGSPGVVTCVTSVSLIKNKRFGSIIGKLFYLLCSILFFRFSLLSIPKVGNCIGSVKMPNTSAYFGK